MAGRRSRVQANRKKDGRPVCECMRECVRVAQTSLCTLNLCLWWSHVWEGQKSKLFRDEIQRLGILWRSTRYSFRVDDAFRRVEKRLKLVKFQLFGKHDVNTKTSLTVTNVCVVRHFGRHRSWVFELNLCFRNLWTPNYVNKTALFIECFEFMHAYFSYIHSTPIIFAISGANLLEYAIKSLMRFSICMAK